MTSIRPRLRCGVSLFVVGACVIAAPTVGAQTPPQTAAAALSGIVTTNDPQPQPLHAAIVKLHSRSTGELWTVTDNEGRFAFAGLVPDSYSLAVTKPAYLRTEYGATRVEGPGTSIALLAGQQMTNVTIRMPRGAVIAGTLFDLDGLPLPNLPVTLSPVRGETAITNSHGAYRIYGVSPGDYLVMASPRTTVTGGAPMMTTRTVDGILADLERVYRSGAPGRIGVTTQPSVSTATTASTRAADAAPRYSLAPVLYPGTISRDLATVVSVREGEVRTGVDFAIMLSGTTKISGTILGPDGQPAFSSPVTNVRPPAAGISTSIAPIGVSSLGIGLSPRLSLAAAPAGLRASVSTNQKDSTFLATNVTPGEYMLLARVLGPLVPRAGATTTDRLVEMWAVADVDVGNTDITGLTLTLRPAMKMTGRIQFDRSSLTPPSDLSRIRVALMRPNPTANESVEPPLVSTTRPDGAFEATGIIPGNYQLTITLPASTTAGWRLRSAMHNGRDLLDLPPFGRGSELDLNGIVITFTDRHTELAGRLETPSGAPAASHYIVAFPANRELWHAQSRRIVFTRPATNGSFTIADLPSGDYLLAALTDLDTATWRRSEFLDQLVPASVKVTIRDEGRTAQDLRITR